MPRGPSPISAMDEVLSVNAEPYLLAYRPSGIVIIDNEVYQLGRWLNMHRLRPCGGKVCSPAGTTREGVKLILWQTDQQTDR